MVGWVAFGCGPLQEQGYLGEPLYLLGGQVVSTGEMEWLLGPASVDTPITVGLFWARSGEASVQQAVSVLTEFPARYQVVLHQPPPEDTLLDVAWSPDTRVALGLPLLYLDYDGDGVRSFEEPLVGNARGIHVLFAESAGEVGVEPAPVSVEPGFQRIGAMDAACDVSGAPVGLSAIDDVFPTDLWVGPAFTQLIDIDCDGVPDDFSACPTGDYLDEWCEQARRLPLAAGHPCLAKCDA